MYHHCGNFSPNRDKKNIRKFSGIEVLTYLVHDAILKNFSCQQNVKRICNMCRWKYVLQRRDFAFLYMTLFLWCFACYVQWFFLKQTPGVAFFLKELLLTVLINYKRKEKFSCLYKCVGMTVDAWWFINFKWLRNNRFFALF